MIRLIAQHLTAYAMTGLLAFACAAHLAVAPVTPGNAIDDLLAIHPGLLDLEA